MMIAGFISEKDIRKYQDDVLNVNLEYWVKLLGDITFHTEFYPITLEDAQTFIDCYDLFEKVCSFNNLIVLFFSSLFLFSFFCFFFLLLFLTSELETTIPRRIITKTQ